MKIQATFLSLPSSHLRPGWGAHAALLTDFNDVLDPCPTSSAWIPEPNSRQVLFNHHWGGVWKSLGLKAGRWDCKESSKMHIVLLSKSTLQSVGSALYLTGNIQPPMVSIWGVQLESEESWDLSTNSPVGWGLFTYDVLAAFISKWCALGRPPCRQLQIFD